MQKESISAVIITYNEAAILERCIQALMPVVDEIVILDSFSTDDTLAIARQYHCVIHQQVFAGFGKQKNDVIALAKNDWVLAVDADEILSEELQQELVALQKVGMGNFKAYRFPLLNNYLGHWIKHGGWYPDPKPRLFNRQYGQWSEAAIHEAWRFYDKTLSFGTLKNDLLHYTLPNLNQHIRKIEKYTELSAQLAVKKQKKCSFFKLFFAPKWFFFNRYILRLGFLDGYHGYLFCKMASFEKWLKYVKIRAYASTSNTHN